VIPVFIYGASSWDKYTIDPASTWPGWFRYRASLMSGWTPWFDPVLGWFPKSVGSYVDAYAIYNNNPSNPSDPAITHPEWIFKDSKQNKLYIPWGCANGTCPQYAGDFFHRGFVQAQLNTIKSIVDKGYTSIFLDDVNLDPRISDGNGNTVLPNGLTAESWAHGFADFVYKIQAQFPHITIIHNSIWYSSAPRDAIDKQIKSADYINCERGFGDANLNPSTFEGFMEFIDHVHILGKNVIQDEYTSDNLTFKIACFLLVYEKGDLMCMNDMFPDIWNSQMDIDFGETLGPRQLYILSDGFYQWQRKFSKVTVTVDFLHKTGTIV
jgi:hypothetical protein